MAVKKSPSFDLKTAFDNKMSESQIDAASARKLHYKACTPAQAPEGIPHAEVGILIPYFDIDGKQTKFWRYRYLKPPAQTGFAALAKKPLRYVQPGKTVNEIYLPPVVKWRDVAAEPLQPIVITEGEFKAACVSINTDHPCIGLGGVWSWKAQRERLPILPMFKQIKWTGRPVFICFDSDAVTNPMVMQAENALAKALTGLGAEPYVVRLPATEDGKKQGVDDFIVAQGPDAFDELLENLEPWSSAKELHELNEEVVYVRYPGLIMEMNTLERMSCRSFVDHAYANRVYYEEQTDSKGNVKLLPKSAPREWLKWGSRAEVPRVTYAPGEDRITESGDLNIWRGWAVEPKKGDISLWKKLLDYIFSSAKPEDRIWFERWLAYPLQYPGTKMYTSPVIWSLEHGTGKSFIGYSLFKIYGSNATEVTDEDLYASHNEWAENRQFVMGDEITSGESKRGANDRLKSMITRQLLRLNPKFIPAYTVPDCINYYFTSNHPDSFFLEDGDRRHFVHEVVGSPLPDSFYKEYEDWIGKPRVTGPGAAALFHHLLTLDLGDFNPMAKAPMTSAKAAMMNIGRSDLSTWVKMLRDDPDTVLRFDGKVIPFTLWRADDLLQLYDHDGKSKVTANGLARELTRQSFRKVANGNGVTTMDGQVRLWAVRHTEKYMKMTAAELGPEYDRERNFKDVKVKKEPKYK